MSPTIVNHDPLPTADPLLSDAGGGVSNGTHKGGELLPCPFCGAAPNIGRWKDAIDQGDDAPTAIECGSDLHDCPASPSVARWTRDEAVAAWNKRAALAAQAVPAADADLARIGELIRTQNNRITDSPIFIVQQKRRICGVDEDYAEGFMWYDARAVESYDEAGKNERDAEREAEGLPPIQWQRGGYVDSWEFVTACFTEQGCKDYIARDGHNLREPRIYTAGSYRNEEWRKVRSYLAASAPAAPVSEADEECNCPANGKTNAILHAANCPYRVAVIRLAATPKGQEPSNAE